VWVFVCVCLFVSVSVSVSVSVFVCVCVCEQLRVRIDDKWYDLSRWRNAHPAGKETNWSTRIKRPTNSHRET